MMTDACPTGVGGVIAQGPTWRAAKVAAFYSAKMNSAQRNYPVREQELLAGVETMARHRNILQGIHFVWLTDHQSLIYFMNQRDLPGRLARWAVILSEFDFTVQYLPGEHNILPDALSWMYNFDELGTARAPSEYVEWDVTSPPPRAAVLQSMPVLVGKEAMALTPRRSARVAGGVLGILPEVSAEKGGLARVVTPARQLVSSAAGKSESSAEFARRMRGRFILKGPREPGTDQEGGKSGHLPENPENSKNKESCEDKTTESGGAGPKVPVVYPNEGDLQNKVRNKYQEDTFFKKVLDSPNEFRNFDVSDGIIRVRLRDRTPLCIPETIVEGRRLPEIIIDQAHSLLAHLGADKTLSYLREFTWWKTMSRDVRLFCQSCKTCQRSKPPNQKPYGLLNPLPVPAQPWEAVGIDFVGPLPLSQDRNGEYDSITVVIDLLTAMVHLVPSRTNYTAREIAELVFAEIYKLHGLPKAIVSDRDVLFTSTFWTHLNKLIGVKLKMSSAYHPETDGSTERANRTIGQMLRSCISPNQRDWVARLPAIEFAINLARSESTGYSPFFLNSGRLPRTLIWDTPETSEYPGIRVFAQRMKNAILAAHDAILGARVKQTTDANRRRRASPFAKDDLVYISTKNISFPKGTARKLVPKFIGPYRLLEDYRNNSFKVELPDRLKQRGVYPVFHSSLLRIHIPNDDRLFPGRLETQVADFDEPESEWAINRIVSHSGQRADSTFEIRWKSGDKSWLPYD
jgi:transposase InsO family protein